jgi:hypothetical protein
MALSNPGIPGIVGLACAGQTVVGAGQIRGIAPPARAADGGWVGLAAVPSVPGYLSAQRAG